MADNTKKRYKFEILFFNLSHQWEATETGTTKPVTEKEFKRILKTRISEIKWKNWGYRVIR